MECTLAKNIIFNREEEKMEAIIRFIKDEDGMELSEYAVVGGILLLGAVGIIATWGGNIADTFTRISTAVTPAGS